MSICFPLCKPSRFVALFVRPQSTGISPGKPSRGSIATFLCFLWLTALPLAAQVSFNSTTLNNSLQQPVATSIANASQVDTSKTQVLTWGAQNLDFTASGASSCNSSSCSQTVTFKPQAPGLRLGAVVWRDSGGNVLATTYLSGIGLGGLGVAIPGTVTTVAGIQGFGYSGDDGPAESATLFLPSHLALDGAGNLYIADMINNRVRVVCAGASTVFGVVCPGAGIIETVAGNGDTAYGGDGAAGIYASLQQPRGIALDGAGNLYIADTGNHRIRKMAATTGIIGTIAGTGSAGYSGDGGPATAAQLNGPAALAIDGSGDIYIADTQNNRIREIDTQGNISLVAGNGSPYLNGDGGPATDAGLSGPLDLLVDSAGNLLIADTQDNAIRAVCAGTNPVMTVACPGAGYIETIAGHSDATGGFDGVEGEAATAALLNQPSGIAIDPAGNLYVSDTQNFRIRKIFAGGAAPGTIQTIIGNGYKGSGGDYDATGHFDSAGNYVSGNFGVGSAADATVDSPYGLAFDQSGNLYIAEFQGDHVRKIQGNLSIAYFTTPVRQDSKSAQSMPVTVENDGNADLTLGNFLFSNGYASDPTNVTTDASGTCLTGATLGAGSSCSVAPVFYPRQTSALLTANQQQAGDIYLDSDALNSPLDIRVFGTASPVNSTTTSVTSVPASSTYGQSVTFIATVTTGSGTGGFAGDVVFFDRFGSSGNQALATVNVNSSGVATYSTTALQAGAHSISVCFNQDGGDTVHLASCSTDNNTPPLAQIVFEQTSVALSSGGTPSGAGVNVTFSAKVTAGDGGLPLHGSVIFFDGHDALGPAVNIDTNGAATYSTATLADGVHTVTASYTDASQYILTSTSAPWKQDVQAASTVGLASTPNPSSYGTPVAYTATVAADSSMAPTGSVEFHDGATVLGSAALAGTSGIATFTNSTLPVGRHTITAVYQGDSNNSPGTSAAIAQTVVQAVTSTSVSAMPAPGIAGRAVNITAALKVTTGASTPTGNVAFTDGGSTLGAAAVAADGTATLAIVLAPGPHSITATYGGDSNTAGSASAPLPLSVVLATTSVALTTNSSPAYVLSNIVFTATVSGNGGAPTGAVSFIVDGTTAASAAVNGGVAMFSDSALAVGTHTITAVYAGDSNDSGSSSAPLSQAVQPIPTTTGLGQATVSSAKSQAVLVATVLAASGPAPTGTVNFANGTATLGSAPLDASGVATLVPDLKAGAYSIVATYSGDSTHAPSTSAELQFSSTLTDFGISISSPSVRVVTKQNATIAVTLTSANGYTDKIGMGCLSLPAAVNCHFSSDSVTLAPGTTQTIQLTIDTDLPLGGGQAARLSRPEDRGLSLAGLFVPASLLLGWGMWRFRRRYAALLVVAIALSLAGAALVTGCGGFSQSSAAPGTYTIQVGGVGAVSNISHYQSVKLTITQ